MKETVIAAFVLLILITAAALAMSVVYRDGRDYERRQMQQQAIERGFAEHDPKTGEWRWVETTKEESK